MHDYLISTEWVRFAFVCGIAVSMLMYERRHLTTGSIVVPGYIAVFLLHPLVLVATFLNAFATYGLVNKVLRRYVLLYGRTKFSILAVVSTLIQTLMMQLSPSGEWLWERDIPIFVGVGYIVPALIAHDMARQGIAKTTKSVLMAGVIVALPIGIMLLADLPGVNDLSPVDGFGHLSFPVEWLPIAVIVSIIASWAVAQNYGCRSGGFIGAALVGMFFADLWQVAVSLVIAGISYLIVAKFLMRQMILFGRRKFSAMLLTSSVIAWPALWVGHLILGEAALAHLSVGSLALTPLLLPGLLANDFQRTNPSRVIIGVAMSGVCTLTVTWWIGALLTGQHLALGWRLVAVGMVLVLFAKQIRKIALAMVARLTALLERERRAAAIRYVRTTIATTSSAVAAWVRTIGRGVVGGDTVLAHAVAGSQPRRDWSANWASWAEAHPEEMADAQRWLQASLTEAHRSSNLAKAAKRIDAIDATAPKASTTSPVPTRTAELEHTARLALTKLLERNRTSTGRSATGYGRVPLRTPNTPLPGDGTTATVPPLPTRHDRAQIDEIDAALAGPRKQ